MTKPIFLLEARFEIDLGFKHAETLEYHYYFENYADAENHLEIFEDKAIRRFKQKWKINEDDDGFEIKVSIKEKHCLTI